MRYPKLDNKVCFINTISLFQSFFRIYLVICNIIVDARDTQQS